MTGSGAPAADGEYRPRIGVKAVIIDGDGRFLLVRRRATDHSPGWALPGGTLERGETAVSCLLREVREETGLTVAVIGLAAVWQTADGEWFGVTYACRYQGGTVVLSDEHVGFRWVTLAELEAEEARGLQVWRAPGEIEAALRLAGVAGA